MIILERISTFFEELPSRIHSEALLQPFVFFPLWLLVLSVVTLILLLLAPATCFTCVLCFSLCVTPASSTSRLGNLTPCCKEDCLLWSPNSTPWYQSLTLAVYCTFYLWSKPTTCFTNFLSAGIYCLNEVAITYVWISIRLVLNNKKCRWSDNTL